MKFTLKNRLFVSFAIGFCFIVFNSLSFAGDSGGIQQAEHSGLKGPATTNKHEKGSLSLQSLLKEHQPKYSYRYYPSSAVYYDIHRKLYFYPEGDIWTISASLPGNLAGKLGDFARIEMENAKPYIDNAQHVKEFPPEDSRHEKKKILSKLIYVLLYEHSPK